MKDKQKIVEDILENYLTLDNEEFMSSMVVQFDEHMIPDVSKEIIEALGDGWISVNDDRKPIKYESHCLGNNKEQLIRHLSENEYGGYQCETEWELLLNVTHWKPLPEPPEEPK